MAVIPSSATGTEAAGGGGGAGGAGGGAGTAGAGYISPNRCECLLKASSKRNIQAPEVEVEEGAGEVEAEAELQRRPLGHFQASQ
jgi:hypothetical protein